MQHAADELAERIGEMTTNRFDRSTVVATAAYAEAMLRTVAASVTPAKAEETVASLLDETVADGYDSWAELNQRHSLVTGEIASVADYLRWRLKKEAS